MARSTYEHHQPADTQGAVVAYDLIRMQENIKAALNAIYEVAPVLDGALIEGIPLVAGNNDVNHKLGRNHWAGHLRAAQ